MMPLSSRPSRTSGGQFAKSQHDSTAAPIAKTRPQPPATTPRHHQWGVGIAPSETITLAQREDALDDARRPPPKRRKLSLPSRHTQTTLDRHFAPAPSQAPKPPTTVTVPEPHGRLAETVNGVRTALDAGEDELAHTSPIAIGARPRVHPPAPQRPHPPAAPNTTATPVSTAPQKKEDKRTLRSQDEGPRLKSELATYFPNYEDVVLDLHKELEFITVDTALYVTDDAPKQQHQPHQQRQQYEQRQASSPEQSPTKARRTSAHSRKGSTNGLITPSTPQRSNSTTNPFNGCSPISLDMLARSLPDHPEDPLSDEHFLKSHRRAERKEKQLRNIEKERAMHEKVQLERLLDGLQGHDWLKVLGLTGITDGEARKYEPKRDYFIAEVQALVDKFREWKEQEKRLRLEKEAAAAAAAREAPSEESEEREETEEGSVGPPSSELNADASLQLQQETIIAARSDFKVRLNHKGKPVAVTPEPTSTAASPHAARPPVLPPSPEVPITSFYGKRYLRDAALGRARHGRNVTAFGHPIPETEEREFALPPDYVTGDTLRARAREQRRRKRASVADAATR